MRQTLGAAALMLVLLMMASTAGAQYRQQGSKLVGTGAVGVEYQGLSVGMSADGNTAVVGGFGDDSYAGAAWVYTRSGGVWSQHGAKLVGTGAVGNAWQGTSVAVSADGNTVVVGGVADSIGTGATWVYTRSGGVWSQQGAKLVGTGAVSYANQGRSVALSADGNTAVVGANGDNGLAGATWVFTRSGGVWSQQGAKLVGTDAAGAAQQGFFVAVSADGNTAVVGGPSDNAGGAMWVYTRSGGVWSQQGTKLMGTGTVGFSTQGASVAVSADGNTAVVGGPSDTGLAGATWVFTRSGGVWSQQGAKLVGTGAVDPAAQGTSVAVSADGNTAVVGGVGDNVNAGATWVYTRSGGVWSQQGAKLVGTGAVGVASQGRSVAVSADGSTVVEGGAVDNSDVGAAWVFVNPPPNHPPDCDRAAAVPAQIWPPNHRLVPVTITGVTDADGDPVTITVTKVTQDEPLDGRDADDDDHDDAVVAAGNVGRGGEVESAPDGGKHDDHHGIGGHEDGKHECADAVIDSSGNAEVRAERSGHGNGRVYTLWFTATDGRGGACDGSVQVCVPHDRHHAACVDDGQNFNSLGPCEEHRHDHHHGPGHDAVTEATLTAPVGAGSTGTLEYSLSVASDVLIGLYDIAGRRVATLQNGSQSAGSHSLTWDTSHLARGLYFCRVQAGGLAVTRSVLVLK